MKTTDRILELDGLRGIAVLLVLVWHYFTCQYLRNGSSTSPVDVLYLSTKLFWSGVDLFFVLSGFLIGGIILTNHHKSNFLAVFWTRRACRILPPFVLLFMAYLISSNMAFSVNYPWLYSREMPALSYLTFTQNIFMGLNGTFGANFMGVTWSLAVEEQFYIIAPLLVMAIGNKYWIRLLIPLVITAFLLRIFFPGFHTYVNTLFRMDALLLGFAVAAAYSNKHQWNVALKHKYTVLIIFAVVLLVLALCGYLFEALTEVKFLWFAIFYTAILTTVLIFRGSKLTAWLRSPLLCFWGTLAYGLYLYHQAISGLLHGYFRDGASPQIMTFEGQALTGLSLILTVLLSMASFHWFESRFINLGKKRKYI